MVLPSPISFVIYRYSQIALIGNVLSHTIFLIIFSRHEMERREFFRNITLLYTVKKFRGIKKPKRWFMIDL